MAWTKQMPEHPVVAVCGATGAVGREFLKVLNDLDFPASEVRAFASKKSEGLQLPFSGCGQQKPGKITVHEMTPDSFEGVDIALFSAGADISKKFRDAVVNHGAVMIDNSSAFRMDDDVPLVVPEVNGKDALKHNGVIANPNCSTIIMAVPLHDLNKVAPIKRVVVSTYQAASGAGLPAMEELYEQTRQFLNSIEPTVKNFPHQLAFNCIPHIDKFMDGDFEGYTKEEWKMVVETKKIFHQNIAVNATCVRVPVMRCHGESVNVEFSKPITLDQAYQSWQDDGSVEIMDDPEHNIYPMPGMLGGTDPVYVGRVRKDPTVKNGLTFWCVGDQIRKGAALNAVQIAEELLPGHSA